MLFRYLKFSILDARSNRWELSFADFNVYNNGTIVDYSSATASVHMYGDELFDGDELLHDVLFPDGAIANGIDNDNSTKFGIYRTNVDYIINFNSDITANQYNYTTANDRPDRDPVSWILYASMDGTNYVPVDTQLSVNITENRLSQTQMFTIADPMCFNKGTKILCLNKNFQEEYIPIEQLKKGDLVKSYKHGYRKIDLIGKNDMINNPNINNECMYKMIKTEENGLIEDLIITGAHSILVDDLGEYKKENNKITGGLEMIDNKYLLLSSVSKDFIKLENTNIYTYYHFILENNDNDDERFGIWANGVLTETPPKKKLYKA